MENYGLCSLFTLETIIQPIAWWYLKKIYIIKSNFYKVYYNNLDIFSSPFQVSNSVFRVSTALHIPRDNLNIIASSKGILEGSLILKIHGNFVNCFKNPISIPGMLEEEPEINSNARYLCIIEKEGIFNLLVEENLSSLLPIILICGRGFPDISTRILCRQILTAIPSITIVGLFDYNVGGFGCLCSYRFGSQKTSTETRKYGIPILTINLMVMIIIV